MRNAVIAIVFAQASCAGMISATLLGLNEQRHMDAFFEALLSFAVMCAAWYFVMMIPQEDPTDA